MCSGSNDECYEVCEEDSSYENHTETRFTCYAYFNVNTSTNSITRTVQHCWSELDSHCPKDCKLAQFFPGSSIYDCCCTGNLCNDVILELNGTGT